MACTSTTSTGRSPRSGEAAGFDSIAVMDHVWRHPMMGGAEGRDFDAIEKTAPFRFDVGAGGATVDELIGQLRWLVGMGIETVFGRVVDDHRIAPIELMGREVIPEVVDL